MINFVTKNILKYTLIFFLLVILVYFGYIFLFNNKKHQQQNIKTEQVSTSSPVLLKKIEQGTYSTSSPVLLNNEEKKKYGIDTDKLVYLEIIEGNLPRLILPPEMIATSSPGLEINVDTDKDGLEDFIETEIYHSDYKNPDTDGDGYKDGYEAENGFDPNVKGKVKINFK